MFQARSFVSACTGCPITAAASSDKASNFFIHRLLTPPREDSRGDPGRQCSCERGLCPLATTSARVTSSLSRRTVRRRCDESTTNRELVDDPARVPLAGIEQRAGEAGLVRAVGEARGLHAERAAKHEQLAALALVARHLRLEVVAREELHPRLGGPHLEEAARVRLVRARREAELAGRLL